MNDTRLLENQARQLESSPLTGPETLELEGARQGESHMARLLREDLQLHADLLELHRIEVTGAEFARRCVAESGMAQSGVKPESGAATLISDLKVASPLDRLRRSQPQRKTVMGGAPGWITAATVLALAVLGTWWYPRISNSTKAIARSSNREVNHGNRQPRAVSERRTDHDVEHAIATPEREATSVGDVEAVVSDRVLADIRYTTESEWDQKPPDGLTFPAEYRLRSGIAELVLDDGTQVVFQGPTFMTVESPRRVRVDEGRVRIQPVANEQDFSIATPTVLLNGRDDLAACLDVGPVDGTLVRIERGSVRARPWANGRNEELSLAADGMDRGLFSPPWRDDSLQPATAVALNEQGEFCSLVDAAGRPLRVTSPHVFAQVLDTSRDMIREDPQQFLQQWQGMLDVLENSAAQTDLNVNGQSLPMTTPQEMMEQFNQVREQMLKGMGESAGGNASSGFSGMLNVNGREQRFSSPDEFLKAQQEMFGPMFGRMMGEMRGGAFGMGAPGTGLAGETSRGTGPLPGSDSRPDLVPGNLNSMSVFSGMINKNGQAMRFTSPEEFNRAMQQLRSGR